MAMTARYTVLDGEVISQVRGGVRRDYVPDPLGSTVALLDNTQTVTDTFEYWPYGEVRARTGATTTPFQFVGTLGYYRDTSIRTYVRARHYKQQHGRWNTVDPLWPVEDPYRYAANNPVTGIDPFGLTHWKLPIRPGTGCGGNVKIDCQTICHRKYIGDLLKCGDDCKKWWPCPPCWEVCMTICLWRAYTGFLSCLTCCDQNDQNPYPCVSNPGDYLNPGEEVSIE